MQLGLCEGVAVEQGEGREWRGSARVLRLGSDKACWQWWMQILTMSHVVSAMICYHLLQASMTVVAQ